MGKLAEGIKVHILVDSVAGQLPEEGIEGTVEFIGLAADPMSRTFPVRVVADNPDRIVRAGLHARVRLVLDTGKRITLPQDAVPPREAFEAALERDPDAAILSGGVGWNRFLRDTEITVATAVARDDRAQQALDLLLTELERARERTTAAVREVAEQRARVEGLEQTLGENARLSRSSALASKATGFPIALISSKLASGLTMDEIPYWRDGTLEKYTPSGDYVVVKFSRWAFEKFPGLTDQLGTQMKAVGEVMSDSS